MTTWLLVAAFGLLCTVVIRRLFTHGRRRDAWVATAFIAGCVCGWVLADRALQQAWADIHSLERAGLQDGFVHDIELNLQGHSIGVALLSGLTASSIVWLVLRSAARRSSKRSGGAAESFASS